METMHNSHKPMPMGWWASMRLWLAGLRRA